MAAWGTNYPRLKSIKEQYDPDNRFNCFHCVGYEPLGSEATTPTNCQDEFNCLETDVQYCELCEAPIVTWMSSETYDFNGEGPSGCFDALKFVAFNPYQIPDYTCSEDLKTFFRNVTTCCPATTPVPTPAPTQTPQPQPACTDNDAQIAAIAAENGFSWIKSCKQVQGYCYHPVYGGVVSSVCSGTCLTDKNEVLADVARFAGFPDITSCSQVAWLCDYSKKNQFLMLFHSLLCGHTCNCAA